MSLLLIIGAFVVVFYVAGVFLYPRQRCKKCQAFTGRDHQPLSLRGLSHRQCRRCGGLGWHVRPMRRLLGSRSRFDGSGVWQGP